MHRFIRVSTMAALALSAAAVMAQAQEKATELTAGILGLQSTSPDVGPSVFQLNTGGAYVSAGFYLSPSLAIEPILTSTHISIGDDGGSVTTYGLGVGLPYYFKKNWGRQGPYLEPRLGWTSFTCTDCETTSQFAAGVALGTKVRLNELAALRIQAAFDYGFENDNYYSTTTFGGSLGLSVFLKNGAPPPPP